MQCPIGQQVAIQIVSMVVVLKLKYQLSSWPCQVDAHGGMANGWVAECPFHFSMVWQTIVQVVSGEPLNQREIESCLPCSLCEREI